MPPILAMIEFRIGSSSMNFTANIRAVVINLCTLRSVRAKALSTLCTLSRYIRAMMKVLFDTLTYLISREIYGFKEIPGFRNEKNRDDDPSG